MTVVRPAEPGDLESVVAIYAHHVLTGLGTFEEVPPTLAEMRFRFDEIRARSLPYLVAVEDRSVVGFAYVAPFRPRDAYRYTVENSVYIAPGLEGLGLGSALLLQLVEGAAAAGARQMVAAIGDSENFASIRAHLKAGFRHVGVLKAAGFKFGRWVDVVLMQRPVGEGATIPPGIPGG